ncbi:hypothetical protein ABE288_14800 [Bacillus salipaludis]|uniref:hypothetical protein n=1 Tax=Bacillus salipaludis TaxID=2547811 RepID=UPI003D1E1BB8
MEGNWIVNIILGVAAFLLTYVFSIGNNTWQTSFFRSGIGFLLFFVFGYILRSVLHQISAMNTPNRIEELGAEEEWDTSNKYNYDAEQSVEESSFQSVPLSSLHNGEGAKDPETIAQMIQSWTENNKEG